MNLVFSPQAWEDYQHWLQTDKKMIRRINELIKDTVRSHYDWSRRITDEHRMVYRIDEKNLEIAQLRFHYAK
jgi:toxin YoeB